MLYYLILPYAKLPGFPTNFRYDLYNIYVLRTKAFPPTRKITKAGYSAYAYDRDGWNIVQPYLNNLNNWNQLTVVQTRPSWNCIISRVAPHTAPIIPFQFSSTRRRHEDMSHDNDERNTIFIKTEIILLLVVISRQACEDLFKTNITHKHSQSSWHDPHGTRCE